MVTRRYLLKQLMGTCCYWHLASFTKIFSMDPKGVVILPSRYSVKETIDRLVAFLEKHGATIYARIDQQSELHKAGREIPPLEFILFGNPKVGGAVMAENPVAALDLPLKIIAWEDKDKNVRIAYNEATYLKDRYSLPSEVMQPLDLGPLVKKVVSENEQGSEM